MTLTKFREPRVGDIGLPRQLGPLALVRLYPAY